MLRRFCCSGSSCHWMTPFQSTRCRCPIHLKTWAISACRRLMQIGENKTLIRWPFVTGSGSDAHNVVLSLHVRLISFYRRQELSSCENQLESRLRSGWTTFKPPPSPEDIQGLPFWASPVIRMNSQCFLLMKILCSHRCVSLCRLRAGSCWVVLIVDQHKYRLFIFQKTTLDKGNVSILAKSIEKSTILCYWACYPMDCLPSMNLPLRQSHLIHCNRQYSNPSANT